jgi:hypothetical protein
VGEGIVSWTSKVVEDMAEMKRLRIDCGEPLDFDTDWLLALSRHKFQAKDLGVRGTWEAQSLFEQPEYAALEWYRGVCKAAYENHPSPFGGPSRLVGLRAALDGGFRLDSSRDAGKPGRYRAAA